MAGATSLVSPIGTATHRGWFTGGCYWTTEAVFERVVGVEKVIPGQVWFKSGLPVRESKERHPTERIEAVEVHWDPGAVSIRDLMEVLLAATSPSLARWDTDLTEMSGLRSTVLVADENDLPLALAAKESAQAQATPAEPVYTQVTHLVPNFVPAPESEWGFYRNRPQDGYSCSLIAPKLERLAEKFGHRFVPDPGRRS